MPELELLELAHLSMSNMLASFAIFLTLVSGYLIIAYTAGAEFSRSQVIIINILFVLMSLIFLFGVYGYGQAALDLSLEARDLNPSRPYRSSEHLPVITVFVNSLAIVSSMYFMWHIRKTK
jgi:hypothetical protein